MNSENIHTFKKYKNKAPKKEVYSSDTFGLNHKLHETEDEEEIWYYTDLIKCIKLNIQFD